MYLNTFLFQFGFDPDNFVNEVIEPFESDKGTIIYNLQQRTDVRICPICGCVDAEINNYSTYGKKSIVFNENSIVVTIPFNWINVVGNKVGNSLSTNRQTILKEMRDNPNITSMQLSKIIKISETATEKNIKWLKANNYIKRIGSNKAGYWEVLK